MIELVKINYKFNYTDAFSKAIPLEGFFKHCDRPEVLHIDTSKLCIIVLFLCMIQLNHIFDTL